MKKIKRLALSWAVSLSRDTYGCNICRWISSRRGGQII